MQNLLTYFQHSSPDAYNLSCYTHRCDQLSVPNQFFMTSIKLRLHTPHFELSRMFGISEYSVSNIVITWINFMYRQWSELNIFPTRELANFLMPDDFHTKFPSTRVIIDGMECPIKNQSILWHSRLHSLATKTETH